MRRVADVEYDRSADTPVRTSDSADGERAVQLDDDAVPDHTDTDHTDREFYERERPPHHGE